VTHEEEREWHKASDPQVRSSTDSRKARGGRAYHPEHDRADDVDPLLTWSSAARALGYNDPIRT
jgi:hypothetical protein